MDYKKIGITLNGISSSKTKNRSITYFCRAENCSLRQQGKCLNVVDVVSYGTPNCKYGYNRSKDGYTTRAAKRYSFDLGVINDPLYNAVDFPADFYVGFIEGNVVLNLKYCTCEKRVYSEYDQEWHETKSYVVNDVHLRVADYSYIPAGELTVDVMVMILKHMPRRWMSFEIKAEYQKEVVPEILRALRKQMPDLYKAVCKADPKYKLEEEYKLLVGKQVLASTITDNVKFYIGESVFYKDGDYLVCDNFKSVFLPINAPAQLRYQITADMHVKATHLEMLNANTIEWVK